MADLPRRVPDTDSPTAAARAAGDFVPFPRSAIERPIQDRFEEQVQLYPGRIAARTRICEWTYLELNRFINRIAHALLSQGAQPGHRIALLIEHDALPIASFIAVLKVGGLCVPLEPFLPESRLRYILFDSQAELLVTNDRNLPLALSVASDGRRVMNVDQLPASLPAVNPGPATAPDDLAHLIYTSGSTGKPKGVAQTHRNVLHDVWGYTNGFRVCAKDRICMLASCSVGAGIKTCFNTLLNGAALLPYNVKEEGVAGLGPWLQQEEISIYISAATVFRHFIATLREDEIFPSMRLVRLASEPVRKLDYECFKQHFAPDCLFANALSSTETGNFTQYLLQHGAQIPGELVPVGYAVEDKEILLLDDEGRELGKGCVGEIAVRSAFLSPGYWRLPELTAAAFQPVPGDPTTRIYRTGDLGFLHPDGCLEHRGRKGFQIKIRGYRVEMEEVGAALKTHPSVKDAVVQARELQPGETRLVAYIVARGSNPKTAELRDFLKGLLPDPMLPAAFVFMDAIPLAPSGKPDRQALPPPPDPASTLEDTFLAPRNAVEEALAAVWADVLRVKRIGVFDTFFDLGGHSLTATQVTSRLRQLFQIELSLREFLQQPTIAALSRLIESRLRAGPNAVEPPITPIPRGADLPLSFAQLRLWFLNQLTPGDPVYNLSRVVRLSGPLDQSALEHSLTEIVRRHETLRTIFPDQNGRPSQKVLEPRPMRLRIVDLSELPLDEAEAEGHRLALQEARRPHRLQEEPSFRALLICFNRSEHLLSLTLHHIISDRWSRWILTQELGALYEAFSTGKPSPLPELAIQYADFAHWQKEWLTGEVLEQQMSYWKKHLGGGIPALELPVDHPRAPVQSSRGTTRTFEVSAEIARQVRLLSRQEGVTPFMTLLAAFQAMLHRYTGQEDFAVGSPIANRNRVETEGLVGFFVNTLVLRADLSGDPTFRQLVGRVREVALEGYAHQDVPFEKIVEELNPERRSSRTPLFQVMFVLQNAPSLDLQLTGQKLSPVDIELGTAMFDLTLSMFESSDRYRGVLEYNTDLFDEETVARMQGHLCRLLGGAVSHPDQHVSELPFLTAEEHARLNVEWNSTEVIGDGDPCLHELFEAQVSKTPEAIALTSEGANLSYRELNHRADELACHLQSLGVGREVAVGIYMERSLEMVVAMLGTLKAGGIYVPLDPGVPRSRLDFIVADTRMSVLLSQDRLRESLSPSNIEVFCLDSDADRLHRQARRPTPRSDVRPDNLAYLIYTSGSTGTPKGVMITHRSICNHTRWMRTVFAWDETDRFLQSTPITFDCAACEIFPSLSVGGRVFITPPGSHRDSAAMVGMIQKYQITTLQVVPSMLPSLLQEPDFRHCDSLRRVLCGGEALPREYADRFRAHAAAELYNLYGPTEVTIDATYHPVRTLTAAPVVPIGKPIANVQVHILDRYRNPLPVGVPGEIYIGGAGLARGYLNRPDLTHDAFIPNPFTDVPGARLYRSGDRGRRLSDGSIEFLGRVDSQVKLRGFRIELGEIEACLSQHPNVNENAVVCREDRPGDRRLVAYLVPRHGQAPSSDELRAFLGQKVPEYMIPSSFVALGALPLMANGKVDRAAFPAPESDRSQMNKSFVLPGTPEETLMAEIWAEVLGIERIGIHDNFFDLGGHSLLATQLVSKLKTAFQTDLPLLAIFENPTIADLTTKIARRRAEKA